MKKLLISGAACLALGTAAAGTAGAASSTKSYSASGGPVTAKVTYTPASGPSALPGQFKNMDIAITGGPVAYASRVNLKQCRVGCHFTSKGGLSVKDLGHTGSYDAVLDIFSGGAHCCSLVQVYYPSGSSYKVATHDFGDPGMVLKDLDHNSKYEFVSADDAFAYTFSDYAESGMPLQILSFANGKYTNVTRHYPKLIKRDAATWSKAYKQDHSSGRSGFAAAWAADEYNLGNRSQADATLQSAVAQHQISAKFVSKLKAFLKQHGY